MRWMHSSNGLATSCAWDLRASSTMPRRDAVGSRRDWSMARPQCSPAVSTNCRPACSRLPQATGRAGAVVEELGKLVLLARAFRATPRDAEIRRAVATSENRDTVLADPQASCGSMRNGRCSPSRCRRAATGWCRRPPGCSISPRPVHGALPCCSISSRRAPAGAARCSHPASAFEASWSSIRRKQPLQRPARPARRRRGEAADARMARAGRGALRPALDATAAAGRTLGRSTFRCCCRSRADRAR